jgi:hypothetical protein
VRLRHLTVGAALSQPLKLDLTERVTDPLGSSRLVVFRKILVAGWESIASAWWP